MRLCFVCWFLICPLAPQQLSARLEALQFLKPEHLDIPLHHRQHCAAGNLVEWEGPVTPTLRQEREHLAGGSE